MKNLKFLTLILIFFSFTVSCKKEKDNPPEQAPESFTKKALLEEFTGEWCPYCPDGAAIIRQLKTDHPDDFIAISYHYGDTFAVSDGNYYDNALNVGGSYPSGVVDRIGTAGNRAYWASKVNQAITQTATCGLELETSIDGNHLKVKVKYAGTEDFDAYLTVDIIEDEVPESSPGAQAGAPSGYKHPDLFRKVVSDRNGDQIAVKKGVIGSKTYSSVDISGYNKDNLYVVAFIHKAFSQSNDRSIYNVQLVKAGLDKDFD